jgi:hypothetical protein
MKKIISLTAFLFIIITVYSQNTTVFSSAPLKKVPVIDGKITSEEYKGASKISGGGQITDRRQMEVWIGYDHTRLYFAARSELPPGGNLLSKARLSSDVLKDDSVELVIIPPAGRQPGAFQFGYFQMMINSEGVTWTRHHAPGWGLSADKWEPDLTQKSSFTKDGFWEIEFSIPLSRVGWQQMPLPSQWKLIISRNFQYPRHQAAFTPATAFNNPNMMASLLCAKDLPIVQQSFPQWNKKNGTVADLTIFNPTAKPMKLRVESGYKKLKIENVSIPRGSSKSIRVHLENPSSNYTYHGKIFKDDKVIFNRVALFGPPPKKKWSNLEASLKFRAPIGGNSGKKLRITNGKPKKYPGNNLSIPGAVVLKFKTETQLKDNMKRIFFKSAYSKQGHFYLYENAKYFLLGFQYFPWQKGSSTQQIVLPKKSDTMKGWQNAVINLAQQKASLYINGILIGSTDFGQSADGKNLGEIIIGTSRMENNFEIAKIETYDRTLTGDEIAMMGLGKAGFFGKISYFPSLEELVVEAEANPFQMPQNPQVTLFINNSASKTIKKVNFDLEKSTSRLSHGNIILRQRIKIPDLKAGEYYTYLRLKSADGTSGAFLGKTFVVKKYKWANNKLGLSDVIVPPFTPLQVKGNEVSCLLKRYIIASNGMPEKILAKGKNILRAPIKLVIKSDGKNYKLQGKDFKFTSKKNTTVTYLARMTSKSLNLNIDGEFDYDGLLKLTFKFHPKKNPEIDQVYLDIPLKKEISKLFHAAGTGNRKNPAGLLPNGKGRIWRSRSISHSFDNFIPYLWVGEEEKGLCYLADWDKDWIHCKTRDAVELLRSTDGNISMRLNLINGPVKLSRNREIVLALMATPIKPMPQGWRSWSDYYAANALPGKKFLQCIYTPQSWGSYFACSGQYPLREDFEIIRKLNETRNTGKIDKKFIESFVQKAQESWVKKDGNMPFAKFSAAYQKMKNLKTKEEVGNYVKMMVTWGFNQAKALYSSDPAQKNTLMYIYFTCLYEPRNMLPEYPCYKDEWQRHMVKSFRDYCIFYANKHLDNGVDGFYLDNTAMAGMKLWPTGDGYIDDNGNIHPSAGIWRIRKYIKRLATLFVEKHKKPFISVHNTNSNALPLYSFATATLGDEWKYGDNDYQERFTPGYLSTINSGRQGGFLPLAIAGITGKDSDKLKWTTRTMLACLLPNEIQPTIILHGKYSRKVLQKAWKIIYDFGKAEQDCKFYPYWKENKPAKTNQPDLLISTYVRDNKLLLVIGNYGNDSTATISVDTGKLGFSAITKAINAETEKSLPLKGNSVILKIKKHDFALIKISAK